MKKITLFIIGLTVLSMIIVAQAIRSNAVNTQIEETLSISQSEDGCSAGVERSNLFADSTLPVVRFLSEAERVCDSQVSSVVWYTISLPKEKEGLSSIALKTVGDLQKIQELGLKPIVNITLNKSWKYQDYELLDKKEYENYLKDFLTQLETAGISQEMVHRWVLLPEPNQPNWDNSLLEPALFSRMHSTFIAQLLSIYPDAKVHLLFNMMTFERKDFSWSEQEYVSVKPYVQQVQSNAVVGMQFVGFMFLPPATEQGEMLLEPVEFIAQPIIIEAFETRPFAELGIITGTFASAHAGSQKTEVIVPAKIRNEVLEKTVQVISGLRKKLAIEQVSITLSTTTLSNDSESDWWYLNTDKTTNPEHARALKNFITSAYKQNIEITLK